MGEFNKRHLDLITYSSICHAKTVLDLYTGNIKKNIRITYIPFFYLKSLKIKQKQTDIVCYKFKSVTSCKNMSSSLLYQTCEKHFNVILLKYKIIIIKEKNVYD